MIFKAVHFKTIVIACVLIGVDVFGFVYVISTWGSIHDPKPKMVESLEYNEILLRSIKLEEDRLQTQKVNLIRLDIDPNLQPQEDYLRKILNYKCQALLDRVIADYQGELERFRHIIQSRIYLIESSDGLNK